MFNDTVRCWKYPGLSGLAFRNNELFEVHLLFEVFLCPPQWGCQLPLLSASLSFFSSPSLVACKVWCNLPPTQTSGARVCFELYWWPHLGCSIIFWYQGCWFNLYSLLGVWIIKVGVRVAAGIWVPCYICITKGSEFISFEILLRKGNVTVSPREAFPMQEWDGWL